MKLQQVCWAGMVFDAVYDHKDEIVKETKKEVKKVGEAVKGFFGNLGSAFG